MGGKTKKTQAEDSPAPQDSEESEPETLEVQVQAARSRKKGVQGHVDQGKRINAAGTAARKEQGAASTRLKKVEQERKKNDRLARLKKVEEEEEAERERGRQLRADKADKPEEPHKPAAAGVHQADAYDDRFRRLEELLLARQSEEPPKKKRAPPKAPPKRRAPPPDSSDEEEEEPERHKQVRRSARSELKARTGALEENLHRKSHSVGNRAKYSVEELDRRRHHEALAAQLTPGRYG